MSHRIKLLMEASVHCKDASEFLEAGTRMYGRALEQGDLPLLYSAQAQLEQATCKINRAIGELEIKASR